MKHLQILANGDISYRSWFTLAIKVNTQNSILCAMIVSRMLCCLTFHRITMIFRSYLQRQKKNNGTTMLFAWALVDCVDWAIYQASVGIAGFYNASHETSWHAWRCNLFFFSTSSFYISATGPTNFSVNHPFPLQFPLNKQSEELRLNIYRLLFLSR